MLRWSWSRRKKKAASRRCANRQRYSHQRDPLQCSPTTPTSSSAPCQAPGTIHRGRITEQKCSKQICSGADFMTLEVYIALTSPFCHRPHGITTQPEFISQSYTPYSHVVCTLLIRTTQHPTGPHCKKSTTCECIVRSCHGIYVWYERLSRYLERGCFGVAVA